MLELPAAISDGTNGTTTTSTITAEILWGKSSWTAAQWESPIWHRRRHRRQPNPISTGKDDGESSDGDTIDDGAGAL